MGTPDLARGRQTRRVVLVTTLVLSVLSLVVELTVPNGQRSEAVVRALVNGILALYAGYELRHEGRTELPTMFIAVTYGVLSIVDSVHGSSISVFDPGATLALLILVAVVYVATRDEQAWGPVVAFSGFIAAYSYATVVVNDYTANQMVAILSLGGLGQIVVIWLIHRLIETLATTSEDEAKHAKIQSALASCSQALLSRGTKEPLTTALTALIDGTETDYAYIDVNQTGPAGEVIWEIVAEAGGDAYPDEDSSFMTGDYRHLEFLEERLRRGQAATVITSHLPMPIRARYESEDIKAELMAPILIGDRWVGTVGYTTHVGEGTWSDIEVEGLMRAAEMVGAYWEREAAQEGLIEIGEAKDRFIATVSHELRTPLAAVVGFAGELAQRLDDFSREEVFEMVSVIFTQGLEVADLVDDLLTSERAASGNLTVHLSDISLLDECKDIVSPTMTAVDIEILGERVITRADGLRTRQILRNLLTNAVRYGGNTIKVEVSATDDHARVVVRDNGPGVKDIDGERIFDPYSRSQDGQTKPDSVGLGLSVARQLARLMSGDLVYRRSQGWTLFELTLPLVPTEAPAQVK
jgi:signal transduction histidine kinase